MATSTQKQNLQKQIDILTQVVELQKQINAMKSGSLSSPSSQNLPIGSSTRQLTTEEKDAIPAARGDDFAENFNKAGGEKIIKKTGGSINDAIDVMNKTQTVGGVSAAVKAAEAKRQQEIKLMKEQSQTQSQRTSYAYNPETTSKTQRAIDRFGFALNEINNDPYTGKGSKDSARMALLESSAKDFAKTFSSPDQLFGAYNVDADIKSAFDKYIKAGGTLNNIAKNITAPVTQSPVTDVHTPPQDTASYLASINNPQADQSAQQKAFDELIPERDVMQARIMQEARIPEELKSLYFGTEEQIGIIEQKRKQAEENKKILEREEKNAKATLRDKAQLQIQKNNADFEITKNKIEENRLAAKNYITGYLAKLGALNTTGAAPLAIQTLDSKYERQATEIESGYRFANREIEVNLTDAVNEVETETDKRILRLEEDLTKDDETIAKEIMKAQQNAEKSIYSITEKYSTLLRTRTAKFTEDSKKAAEKYAKEYLKTAAGGVDLKAIANKISTGEGEEGMYIVQGKKKGVILPDGSISALSLTPTQQTEVESAKLRGEDTIRYFITLPKAFRDTFIQGFDGNGTVSMNRLKNAYLAYQAKIEADKRAKETEKKSASGREI